MNAPASRARAAGAALLLAAFVAGVAVGLAVERVMRPEPHVRAAFGADMPRVLDRLELTVDQRARAEAIIERRAPRTEAMMLELADRLHAVSDSLDAELRAILTPQQRARLDSLRSDRTIMFKRKVVGPDGKSVTDTLLPRRD